MKISPKYVGEFPCYYLKPKKYELSNIITIYEKKDTPEELVNYILFPTLRIRLFISHYLNQVDIMKIM